MNTKQKRALTGSRPSGLPHLGNYFGAFKPLLDLQDRFQLFFFLADFHTFDTLPAKEDMRKQSFELLSTLLACGLDPNESCIFAQSSVPEVTELAWYLSCVCPVSMLNKATSYKDSLAKGKEANAGLLFYPVLMAADILLYDADVVPVGPDQKQHLEFARDFAGRFNHRYGEILKQPEPIIESEVLVPGTDGQKMSSSYHNVISIFATDKQWKKQIMSIETDAKGLEEPKDPDNCHVLAIYKLLASDTEMNEISEKYRAGGFGYGHAKLELLEKVKSIFGPMRERYLDYISRPDDLRDIILESSKTAREIAAKKLDQVQAATGFIGRPF